MFKNRNRTYVALCLVLIGTCSSVFAVDFSQSLNHMNEGVSDMWSLFAGKPVVANIYSKALKLAKDREVSSTTSSFGQLRKYYRACIRIQDSDFINVLYNSNSSFKQTFELLLSSWAKMPDSTGIDKSYTKFFVCENMTGDLDSISSINSKISRLYYDGYSNAYALSTLNQNNFWSDLFRNGTLDDSSFDLLYDINQIGKILFENFKDSPEVLFYRLPQTTSSSTQNGSDLSSLSDQGSYVLWGGWWSSVGTGATWSSSAWATSSSWSADTYITNITSSSSVGQWSSSDTNEDSSLPSDDKDINAFIEKTNGSVVSTPATDALVFWNQCLVWDTSSPIDEWGITTPTMTSAAYVSGIVAFVSGANFNDVVDTYLLTIFKKNNPLPPWWSTSASGYGTAIANTYAEKMLGDGAPWSCEYTCKDLPLGEQALCQLKCAKSCIQTCTDTAKLSASACKDSTVLQKASCTNQILTETALCTSDCTCSMVSGPGGAWREGVEDMFRIKFCKVPVQKTSPKNWGKAFSIQAIFQEISDVLQWLRDSGQMVKFTKTKEFLDTNIKIKLADNLAFKLQIGFKSVFSRKSTTTTVKEQQQANAYLNLGILDINTTAPEADNYNKYIVISDPVKNAASMQPASSLADLNQNIEDLSANVNSTTKLSDEAIDSMTKTYVQWANVVFIQNMVTFLKDNQLFLDDLSKALLNMNEMSLELKAKIQSAK